VDNSEKAKDARIRRLAERQGYRIAKCRSRDPKAIGYGTYCVFDDGDRICAGDVLKFGLSLDDIDKWLEQRRLVSSGNTRSR
jgi:hypothetical protein